MPPEFLALVAMIFGPAGAAYVGVKVSLNGMRSDVTEIKADVKALYKGQGIHGERLMALETTIDLRDEPGGINA